MAKKNPTTQSLRSGQTVYCVNALGERSHIHRVLLTSKALTDKSGYMYVKYTKTYPPSKFKILSSRKVWMKVDNNFGLKDCNLIPNSYNNHRLFYSRKKAEAYVKRAKLMPYQKPHPTLTCLA